MNWMLLFGFEKKLHSDIQQNAAMGFPIAAERQKTTFFDAKGPVA